MQCKKQHNAVTLQASRGQRLSEHYLSETPSGLWHIICLNVSLQVNSTTIKHKQTRQQAGLLLDQRLWVVHCILRLFTLCGGQNLLADKTMPIALNYSISPCRPDISWLISVKLDEWKLTLPKKAKLCLGQDEWRGEGAWSRDCLVAHKPTRSHPWDTLAVEVHSHLSKERSVFYFYSLNFNSHHMETEMRVFWLLQIRSVFVYLSRIMYQWCRLVFNKVTVRKIKNLPHSLVNWQRV